MERHENPEQEQQEGSQQEEGVDPTDGLLSIFQQEAATDLEVLSLVEGLEDVDLQDLLQEFRGLAKRFRDEKLR